MIKKSLIKKFFLYLQIFKTRKVFMEHWFKGKAVKKLSRWKLSFYEKKRIKTPTISPLADKNFLI